MIKPLNDLTWNFYNMFWTSKWLREPWAFHYHYYLPAYVGEDIFPAKAVYPRGLREVATLAVENAIPRVE